VRPYYWPQRIAIGVVCFVAVLLLSLGGCRATRPVDISACYQRCVALDGAHCDSRAFAGWAEGSPAQYCVCTCHYSMPFADGGGR
jgi:hypothetical protein